MPEVPLHRESFTTAAIDGARIAVMTADLIAQMDATLDEHERHHIREALAEARQWLDAAREPLRGPITSVHVVEPGGIIVPP